MISLTVRRLPPTKRRLQHLHLYNWRPLRRPYFITSFEPQKKHFLHHINNKCCIGKYILAFTKISPPILTNRPFFDATEKYAHRQTEEAWALAEQLIANSSPDGYFVQGLITGERGDTLEGKRLIEKSASLGSTIAEFFLCIPDGSSTPDVERLVALSDSVPYVKILLARLYRGEKSIALRTDSLAADCLIKADQQGFLGRMLNGCWNIMKMVVLFNCQKKMFVDCACWLVKLLRNREDVLSTRLNNSDTGILSKRTSPIA